MPQQDFAEVFAALKPILAEFAPSLVVMADTPDLYYLNTTRLMPNKQPLFFGSVQIKKNYVSVHLFPVYCCPELLGNLSPELQARMQGKACFNFKKVDTALFEQLAALTKAGFTRFAEINDAKLLETFRETSSRK